MPTSAGLDKYWIEFTVEQDPWEEQADRRDGVQGVNNMNTLPLSNIPYKNINSIGKQWIRKYGLALVKELLGIIRSKYGAIPIPGAETSLDGDTLRTEAATEKEALTAQLREILEQTSRRALLEADKDEAEFLQEKLNKVPYPIYIG